LNSHPYCVQTTAALTAPVVARFAKANGWIDLVPSGSFG
jgi:hypothetical protein